MKRCDRHLGDLLKGKDHGFLGELQSFDTCASDDEVRIWLCDMITPNHFDVDV